MATANFSNHRYLSLWDHEGTSNEDPLPTIISDSDEAGAEGGTADFNYRNIKPTNEDQLGWPRQLQLRLVDSEREHFLKSLNINLLRVLVKVQVVAFTIIVISQVGSCAFLSHSRYILFWFLGILLWSTILFLTPACWLNHINTKAPTGCSIGFGMAFQILSIIVEVISIFLCILDLANPRVRQLYHTQDIILYLFLISGSLCIIFTCLTAFVFYCRATCCSKSKMQGDRVFVLDVETVRRR